MPAETVPTSVGARVSWAVAMAGPARAAMIKLTPRKDLTARQPTIFGPGDLWAGDDR